MVTRKKTKKKVKSSRKVSKKPKKKTVRSVKPKKKVSVSKKKVKSVKKKIKKQIRIPVKHQVKRLIKKPAKKIKVTPTNEDILEKYSKQTGMEFNKPTSLSEFDKHLEETARLVSGESESKDLPHFTDDHIAEVKATEQPDEKPTEKDIPSSTVGHMTPNPDHDTLSATHSHPYTEHSSSLFEDKHERLPAKHRHALNATVLAFFGVVVPLISILAFIVSIKSVKKGSHTGKGAALLSVATFIINLVLIYLFYTMALGV